MSGGVITGSATDAAQTRVDYLNVIPVGVSGYTITAEYDPSQSMGIVQLRVGDNESGWAEVRPFDVGRFHPERWLNHNPDGWVRVSVTSKIGLQRSIRMRWASSGRRPNSWSNGQGPPGSS